MPKALPAKKKIIPPLASTTTYASDAQLAQRYGVCRPTIWRWVKQNAFPQPVKISPGCTRWRLADVEAWEDSRVDGGMT